MRCRQDTSKPFVQDGYLKWQRPYGGAKGQQVTRWDIGYYNCDACGAHLSERDVVILGDVIYRPFPWGMTESDWVLLDDLRKRISSIK